MSDVTVDREALREILEAVTSGNDDLINYLRAGMSDLNSPVMVVIRGFNSSVAYQTITKGLFDEPC